MINVCLLFFLLSLLGPLVAGLVNKFGCRNVGVGGALVATVGMFVSAFMPTIEMMIVSYGIIAGEPLAMCFLVSFKLWTAGW